MHIDILPSISIRDLGQAILGRAVVYIDNDGIEQTSFITKWNYPVRNTYTANSYLPVRHHNIHEIVVTLENEIVVDPNKLLYYTNDNNDETTTLSNVFEELRTELMIKRSKLKEPVGVDLFLRGS